MVQANATTSTPESVDLPSASTVRLPVRIQRGARLHQMAQLTLRVWPTHDTMIFDRELAGTTVVSIGRRLASSGSDGSKLHLIRFAAPIQTRRTGRGGAPTL